MILKPTSSSLLISLSTHPEFQTDSYLNSVVKNLKHIKKSRQLMLDIKKDYDYFFEPIMFAIMGSWDICVLTVSDNSEITTKILQPEISSNIIPSGQISSKLYSGISYKNVGSNLSELYDISQNQSIPFIGIVNLKFSSKWLMPNAKTLNFKFLDYLKNKFEDSIYFPVQTFNTYEMTIVFLGDNLKVIADNIFEIRELQISTILTDDDLLRTEFSSLNFGESHLFSDTHSYFGVRLVKNITYKNNGETKNIVWNISEANFNNVNAVFEFETKPGHSKNLEAEINKITSSKTRITKFQSGHYDFFINWEYDLSMFKNLFYELKNNDSKLKKHIRNLKTRLLFDYSHEYLSTHYEENFKIGEYFNLKGINDSLKTIKVSKSLRNQIVKLFYSFQNSIANKVTCVLFLDLFFFVKSLEYKIDKYKLDIKKSLSLDTKFIASRTVHKVEEQLGIYVSIYKDAYYLRYVNDRNIEDVQDFLIPYNTQLQTVISFYDSYVKCILSILVKDTVLIKDDKYFGNSMILTFDEHITEVNPINIKLLSSNLFEAGLIFTALSKEIVTVCSNSFVKNKKNPNAKYIKKQLINFFTRNPKHYSNKYKQYFINFDFNYGVADYLRYKYFYKSNFELFLFYHIGFLIQYPKMYDVNGNINKEKLFTEVFRLLILNQLIFELENTDNYNKINSFYISPDISGIWKRYLNTINSFVQLYIENTDFHNSIFEILKQDILDNEVNLNYNSLIDDDNNLAYKFVQISYKFMETIYQNSKIVQGVSRTWENGKVNKDFIKSKNHINEPLFLFDSQGGAFFIDFIKLSKYSELRNQVFEDLRYLSLEYKSQLLNKIINEK